MLWSRACGDLGVGGLRIEGSCRIKVSGFLGFRVVDLGQLPAKMRKGICPH